MMAGNPYLELVEQESAAPEAAAPENPYTAVVQELDQEDEAKTQRLGAIFEHGLKGQPERQAGILEIARRSGAPADIVEARYDEFRQAAEAKQFDPAAFRRDHPELAELVLEQPEVGPVIMRDPKVSEFTKNVRTLEMQQLKAYLEDPRLLPPGELYKTLPSKRQDAAKARLTELEAEEKRDATPVPVIRDPSSDQGFFAKVSAAYRNTKKGLEYSELGAKIMARRIAGQDAFDLEKRAVDLERELGPRDYDANFVEQLFINAAEIAPSQLETLKGAGVGGAIGAGAAGAGAFAITRNPAAAKQAAGVGLKVGGASGAALKSFELEAGGAFLDFRRQKTDDGKPVEENVALGAAVAYGAVASAVEVMALGPFLKTLGPLGDAMVAGQGKAFIANLMKDAGARKILADAGKRWVKGAGAEAAEEVAQHVLQDLAAYAARSTSAGKLQKADPGKTLAEAADVGVKTLTGSLVIGVGGAAVNVTTQTIAKGRAEQAGQRVAAIVGLSDSPSVRASPEAIAKLVEQETAASGEPVTHLYIDPVAFETLFQENGADPSAAAVELLGEQGAQAIAEAKATGQKLEVPVEQFLEVFGPKGVAEKLQEHITTRPWHETAAEAAKSAKDVEAQAKAIADKFSAGEEVAPESDAEAQYIGQLEAQLKATGQYEDTDVAKQVALHRAFTHTMAARSGVSAEQLFQDQLVTVQKGAEAAPAGALQQDSAPESLRVLKAAISTMDGNARARALYTDRTTGLLNDRAFRELAPPVGKGFVAIVSVPGVKGINDDPDAGGHDKANGLYRMAGKALADAGVEAFKVGGDLRLYVKDQAELDAILAKANELMPVKGAELQGAIGPTPEAADAARNTKLDELRAQGAYPKRGEIPAAFVGKLAEVAFPEARAEVSVPAELEMKAASLGDRLLDEAFVEPTGALTAQGWHSIPRKAHVTSIDLSGLKVANDALGKQFGNDVLAAFTRAAIRIGGQALDFAHLSGDEYAAQSNDPAELQRFIDDLRAAAQATSVIDKLSTGGNVAYKGLQFWDGIGATYDEADRALNRTKRDRQAQGEVRGGRDRIRRFAAGREGDQEVALLRERADSELRRIADRRAAERAGRRGDGRARLSEEVDPDTFEQGEPKNLLVQHNLTAENLIHADELGGLAAPSLAVARKEHPLEGYGEITLIAGPEMVDPENGTPVFNADVYSPRHPETAHRVNGEAAFEMVRELRPLEAESGGYVQNLDGELEREGFERILHESNPTLRPVLMLAFLKEQGVDPRLKHEPAWQKRDIMNASLKKVGGNEAFIRWAKEKLKPVLGERYIRKGQRKIPYTLENILKEVTRKIRQGEDFNYGVGTARAAGAKRFRSLAEIKAARDQVIGYEKFAALKDETSERLGRLADALTPYDHTGDPFYKSDGIVRAIGESYKKGRRLAKELDAQGFKGVPAELVQEIAQFANDILAMPTEYFEAKPQRAVSLDEFKAAVVPQGVNPEALKVLEKHGIAVETYDRKDETARRAAIERAAAKADLLFQGAAEKLSEPRGYVQMARDGVRRLFNIVLNPKADVSTFLHESGHVFLEMLGDLAERPDAPDQVRADYAATLKYLGVEKRGDVKREQHEKWARAFEAYLYEGKAPSLALVRPFERFKRWLKAIYRSIASLDVELNEDIRGVFDRLLATDEEIERAKGKMGLRPLYRSPAEAGMSPEEWQSYLDAQEEATSHSLRVIERRVLEEKQRETEAWWKKELKAERELAAEEYHQIPEVRASRFFRQGEAGDNLVLKAIIDHERKRAVASGKATVPAAIRGQLTKLQPKIAALEKKLGLRTGYVSMAQDPEGGVVIGQHEAGPAREVKLPRWMTAEDFLAERSVWEWTWSALKDGPAAPEQAQKLVAGHVRRALEEFPVSEFGLKQAWTVAKILEGKGGKKWAGLRRELAEWMATPEGARAEDPIPAKTWGALIDTARKETKAVSTSRFINFKKVEVLTGWLKATTAELDTARPDYLTRPPAWYGAEVAETKQEETTEQELELVKLKGREAELKAQAAAAAEEGVSARPRLEFETVAAILGKDALKLRGITTDQGGLAPDDVAELLGFETGDALVRALAEKAPGKEAWVKQRAEERMKERHGDLLEERTRLAELAESVLAGDHTATWLLKEWAALRSRVTPGLGGPPLKAIQRAAELIVERRIIGRMSPYNSLRTERAAAEKAAVAAAKKDFAQAFVAKQQQLLNLYLYAAMRDAVEERDSMLELARKLSDDKARGRLGKASPAYRDAVDGILEGLGLAEPRQREQPPVSLAEAIGVLEDNGGTVAFDQDVVGAALAQGKPWRELTVAEMREVARALTTFKKAASNLNTVLFEGKRVEKDLVIAKLLAEAAANLPDKGPPKSRLAKSQLEKALALVSEFDGNMLRPETMVSMLGGERVDSAWMKALILPLQAAKHREADILKTTMKPVLEVFEKVPPVIRRRWMELVDGKALFPNHTARYEAPVRRFELVMMALNLGNEGNRERLLGGRNITMDEVMVALDTLTKEEWDWAQAVLDAMESLWPLSRELEERDTGIAPEKVQATPITTKFGVYRGGYFPAVYAREAEVVGELQAAQMIVGFLDPSFTRPGTHRSHLKKRADTFGGVIALDPSIITRHLAQVAHDIAFREAIKSVGSLLMDESVRGAMVRRLTDERARTFMQWMKDVGAGISAPVATHATAFNRLVRAMKSNAAIGALGYSASVALGDFSNLLVGGAVLKKKHWAAGMADFFNADKRAMALEKSGELRYRRGEVERQFNLAVAKLTAQGFRKTGPMAFIREHAFTFMEWTDKLTSTPIWLGAYRQGLAEGKEDADAISFADATVRKLFPSASAVDQSAILRDRGWLGSSLMFFGYLNTMYQANSAAIHAILRALGARDFGTAAKRAGVLMALWAAYGPVSEFLTGRGPEEDEELEEWLARKFLLAPVSVFPYVGGIAESVVLGKKPSVRQAPMFAMLESVGRTAQKAMRDEAESDEKLFETLRSMGVFVGLPGPPLRAAQYLTDLAQGEAQRDDPAGIVSGVVYGERDKQPKNPFTAVGGE